MRLTLLSSLAVAVALTVWSSGAPAAPAAAPRAHGAAANPKPAASSKPALQRVQHAPKGGPTAKKGGRRGHVGPSPAALAAQRRGKSVGSPTDGHLEGGAHLETSSYLRIVPAYAGADVRWGVGPLVSMIDRAARLVNKQWKDAVLGVGHLSRRGGGEIDRHASHESGRDVDLAFYVKNNAGKSIHAEHFVAFVGDGTAPTWPGAHFDDAKNWALVSAIVTDPGVRISHIFVATPIRARLLAYAAKVGASPSIRNRAAELMAQPRGSLPHDDHFHVRISCPSGMGACVENPRKKPSRTHGAATAKATHGAHGKPARAHDKPAHAPQSKPAAPPKPKAAAPSAEASDTSEASEATEASTPTLGPVVPGLDSAILPAKIGGTPPPPPARRGGVPTPPPNDAHGPEAPPISDPDGILDN